MFRNRRKCVTQDAGFSGWRFCVVACMLLQLQCARPVREGQPAPSFTLTALDGHRVELVELKGKVAVLHFWATWCPPCLVELPELIRFSKNLDPDKVVLLPVCVDNAQRGEIKKFLSSWGFEITVYLDPGGNLARRYGTYRYPETYIIDAQGVVQRKIIGPGDWRLPKWARFLQKLSEKPGDASDG